MARNSRGLFVCIASGLVQLLQSGSQMSTGSRRDGGGGSALSDYMTGVAVPIAFNQATRARAPEGIESEENSCRMNRPASAASSTAPGVAASATPASAAADVTLATAGGIRETVETEAEGGGGGRRRRG
eukprot:g6890.t1